MENFAGSSSMGNDFPTKAQVVELIQALHNDYYREQAINSLSKAKESCEEMGLLLWNSCNTPFVLLQEVTSVYPALSTPSLTERASTIACNAISLFKCMALHPETRMSFIKAKIPIYLYPFLQTPCKDKAHEYLRLSSLGIIACLIKSNDAEVIKFLITSEVFPPCLRSLEFGQPMSKTVGTLIIERILSNDEGLKYCCVLAERFHELVCSLGKMIEEIAQEASTVSPASDSKRLLKHILSCYLRLSEGPRARDTLNLCLPAKLKNASLTVLIRDDPEAMSCLRQLFHNVLIGNPRNSMMENRQDIPSRG